MDLRRTSPRDRGLRISEWKNAQKSKPKPIPRAEAETEDEIEADN